MPDQKSARAAELREDARKIRDAAEKQIAEIRRAAEEEATALETAAAVLEGIALTSTADSTNKPTMGQANVADSTEKTRGLARGRGRSKAYANGHAFVKALYAKGMTVTDWAAKHGLKLATVSSWVATSENGRRRIPLEWAQKIEKEFGRGPDKKLLLPATRETWPNGITD